MHTNLHGAAQPQPNNPRRDAEVQRELNDDDDDNDNDDETANRAKSYVMACVNFFESLMEIGRQ